jgi:hypothetical protein
MQFRQRNAQAASHSVRVNQLNAMLVKLYLSRLLAPGSLFVRGSVVPIHAWRPGAWALHPPATHVISRAGLSTTHVQSPRSYRVPFALAASHQHQRFEGDLAHDTISGSLCVCKQIILVTAKCGHGMVESEQVRSLITIITSTGNLKYGASQFCQVRAADNKTACGHGSAALGGAGPMQRWRCGGEAPYGHGGRCRR